MPLSRPALAFALVLALAFAGCIENMGDLKDALGVKAPPPPAEVFLAPVAKAQSSTSTALVGERVTFESKGTKDAQELPLDLAWDFGDGATGRGATTSHAYGAPGEYKVRLTATNTAGLTDEDSLVVKVAHADRAPTATLRVSDAQGAPTTRGRMGEPLAFEAIASDPEGASLAYAWDFGDGLTSATERASHAYDAPGAYDITLRVTDRAANAATATAQVLIDGAWTHTGAFEPAGAATYDATFPVAAAARELALTLTFEPGAGLNDLEIVLLDANGDEVRRSAGEGTPGASGEQVRTLELGPTDLDELAAGTWTAQVLRERGLAVAWTLEIDERC